MIKIVPKGWKVLCIEDIFEYIPTCSHSKNLLNYYGETCKNAVYNIHYGDIHAKYCNYVDIDTDKVPYLKEAKGFNERNLLIDGDLVMVDASEDLKGVGTCIELKNLRKRNCIAGLHTFALRDKHGLTTKGYRTLLLKHLEVKNRMKQISTYSKVYGISKSGFSKVDVFLPPMLEQIRIVAILETWDKALEKLNRKIEIKKNIKKGLLQKLMTGRVRLQGFKREWIKVKLGDFTDRIRRKNDMGCENILTISAQYGLISQQEIFNKRIAANNLENYLLLKKGEFAYNKSYSKGYPMGAIKKMKYYENGVVSSLYLAFKADNSINSDFLEYYFDAGLFNKEISMVAQEGARNHGLLNIKAEDFFLGLLRIPEFEEQTAIANILTTADNEISALERKRNLLEQQKKFLLNNLVTGKIRTPENLTIES